MVAVNVAVSTSSPAGDAAIAVQNGGSVATNDTTGQISGTYFSSYRSNTTYYSVDITASGGGTFSIGDISGINSGTQNDSLLFQGLDSAGSVISGYNITVSFNPTDVNISYSSLTTSLNFNNITTLRVLAINNYGGPFYFDSADFTSISSGSGPSSPSVSSISRVGAAAVAAAATDVDYTVTFSEAVTGVDISDFNLTGSTGTASGTVASVTGSGTTYTVTVNALAGDGTLRLDLNGSGTGIQNAANTAIAGGYTAGQTYTLDHTVPAAPGAAPTLTALSDSGPAGDGITNVTTPTLTGTAEAGATVTLYDTDGTTVLGTATANGQGAYSITSSSLAQGSHSLTVKATDAAGNTSAASLAFTLSIDTAAPATPGAAPGLALASDSGTAGDGITNTTTPILSGTAEAGVTVKLYDTDGTTVLGTATANGQGAYSITSSTLAQGNHTLTVTATDAAGNISAASPALMLTIDTAAPSTPSAAPALALASDSGATGDGITV
ncbi:Ig-like domain-containing protein, partial [Methylobacterium hispanicum]